MTLLNIMYLINTHTLNFRKYDSSLPQQSPQKVQVDVQVNKFRSRGFVCERT